MAELNQCLQKPWYLFNCTGLGLNYVPKFPLNTKGIILTNNDIKVVNDSFVGLWNINYLWVNKNGLETFYLSNISIISMSRLFFLDLSDNHLHYASIPTDFKIPSLIGLAIHNNVYDQYPETFISSMVKLQNLSIDVFDGSKFGSGLIQSRNLSRLDFFQRSGSPFYLRNDSFLAFKTTKITNLDMPWFGYMSASFVEVGVFSPFHHLLRFRFDTNRCSPSTLWIKRITDGIS